MFELENIIISLVTTVTLVFLYLRHTYSYWTRKGLPQPPVLYGFGNYLDVVLLKSTVGHLCDHLYRSYPDREAVGLYDFLKPKLLVRSPELIKRVLISDFSSFHDNEFYVSKKLDPHFYMDPFCLRGEEWKPARAKMMATMTAARMKEIFPVMKEIIPRFDAYLNESLGKDIEAKELSTLFTMDNVSNVVYGISSNCFTDPEAAFRKMADIQMNDIIYSSWQPMIMGTLPKLRDFLGLRVIPKVVCDYLENLIKEILNHRTKNNVIRKDLFQFFMKKDTGDGLDDLMFYAVTFFTEGFETSSMVVSKTLYELAVNPEIQQKVYEEVRAAFGDKADPDYDTLFNLPYLDKVIQETNRKYPLGYNFARLCTKKIDLEIEGKSVTIEPGTSVMVPVFSVHRDPLYFPDPEVFDPERFSEENKPTWPPGTYIPFGEGPRICPGSRFAQVQMKLLVANLVYKFRIVCSEKTPQKLTFSKTLGMVSPNEQMWIRIEKRK